ESGDYPSVAMACESPRGGLSRSRVEYLAPFPASGRWAFRLEALPAPPAATSQRGGFRAVVSGRKVSGDARAEERQHGSLLGTKAVQSVAKLRVDVFLDFQEQAAVEI